MVKRIILKNKPLVEAIFELRWELSVDVDNNLKKDPYYPLLIGVIYEKVKEEYPFHEELDASKIPHELAGYLVQHRFRKEKDGWPLIQLGPGIMTVNDTEGYVWENFRNRVYSAIDILCATYPNTSSLKFRGIMLRYIDAVQFNFEENVFEFIKDQLKVDIKMHDPLFEDVKVSNIPSGIDLRWTYKTEEPKGQILLQFARGKSANKEEGLIWNTITRATDADVPSSIEKIKQWIEEAHTLSDDWFFKLIDGDLLERFK